jgi:RNA polymerase sigma-70 factor (ECF subfamily)
MPIPTQEADSSSSATLVERLQSRQPAAWQRLSQLYTPLVYGWARRAGLGDGDAHDVVQEVFIAVAAGIDGFRRDRTGDSFRGWLRGIARHKLQDHYRRRAAAPDAPGGSEHLKRLQELEAPDDVPPASDNDLAELVRRAAELLRSDFQETTWRAFWRLAVDGLPAAAVAEELGLTTGAVHAARFRVLKRLRDELA